MNRNEFRRCVAAAVIGLLSCVDVHGAEPASFTRGHLYVVISEPEACDFGGREWIVEVDPFDGSSRIFADSNHGLCGASGLRFTPEGNRLLVVNFGHYIDGKDGGWVREFRPDGTSEIILDASDGLASPSGLNALDFDRDGNLYVVSGATRLILRFPATGGLPAIFADSSDGIDFRGPLDFAPNGDLFYGSSADGNLVRIQPDGSSFPFDDGRSHSIGIDGCGNLFRTRGGSVYRYDYTDAGSARLLTSSFAYAGGLAVSADGRTVFVTEGLVGEPFADADVYAVDADTGTTRVLADLSGLTGSVRSAGGIAIYAPRSQDVTFDGSITFEDAGQLLACLHGPSARLTTGCCAADLDGDADADLRDFASLQAALAR